MLDTLELRDILLLSTIFLAALVYIVKSFATQNTWRRPVNGKEPTATPPSPMLGKRRSGEWIPELFTYPPIEACPHPLRDVKPVPYRPFRWGPYHITMGIRSMSWSDWIELDNQFEAYHRIRKHRIATCGEGVVKILPSRPGLVSGGADGALELVHTLAGYVSQRYPESFSITRWSASALPKDCSPLVFPAFSSSEIRDDGPKTPIHTITIHPIGDEYVLPVTTSEGGAEEAMRICAHLIQDDLAIMVEGTDGKYYFQGGAICVAGFWRMRDKIGLPLEEIHISGHVPRYTEKLETSMERFFRRMSVDKPVVRNNYFVQLVDPKAKKDDMDPEELAWSHTTNGPEDAFEHGNSAHPPVLPQATPETLRLRTERQTLRRLPGSGVIVFTIRTYVIPAVELGREMGVPGRLASALRSWPEDIARYKGARLYWDVLVEYMEKCSKEQAEEENNVEEKLRYPY